MVHEKVFPGVLAEKDAFNADGIQWTIGSYWRHFWRAISVQQRHGKPCHSVSGHVGWGMPHKGTNRLALITATLRPTLGAGAHSRLLDYSFFVSMRSGAFITRGTHDRSERSEDSPDLSSAPPIKLKSVVSQRLLIRTPDLSRLRMRLLRPPHQIHEQELHLDLWPCRRRMLPRPLDPDRQRENRRLTRRQTHPSLTRQRAIPETMCTSVRRKPSHRRPLQLTMADCLRPSVFAEVLRIVWKRKKQWRLETQCHPPSGMQVLSKKLNQLSEAGSRALVDQGMLWAENDSIPAGVSKITDVDCGNYRVHPKRPYSLV
jgi:hypothetical protein